MKQVQTPSSSRRTQCSRRDVPPGYKVHLQSWIGGWYVSHRQAKLATNNIAALCDGGRLVERYLAVAALTPKATVARHNQRSGGTYFSALRTSAATSSGRSACRVRWLTAPRQIFFLRSFLNGSNSSRSF